MRDWSKDWEMCQKATPGPWNTVDGGEVYPISGPTAYVELCRIVGLWDTSSWYDKDTAEANGKFIAAAREALPYWLQRVRKAEELLRRVMDVLPQRMLVDNVNPPQCMTIKRSRQLPELCETMCKGDFCEDKRLRDEIEVFLKGELRKGDSE